MFLHLRSSGSALDLFNLLFLLLPLRSPFLRKKTVLGLLNSVLINLNLLEVPAIISSWISAWVTKPLNPRLFWADWVGIRADQVLCLIRNFGKPHSSTSVVAESNIKRLFILLFRKFWQIQNYSKIQIFGGNFFFFFEYFWPFFCSLLWSKFCTTCARSVFQFPQHLQR